MEGGGPDPYVALARAKAKKEMYAANLKEIEYKRLQKELIPVAEVEQAIATAFGAIAQGLRGIPDNIERRTGCAPEIIEAIEQALDAEMSALADKLAVLGPVEVPE